MPKKQIEEDEDIIEIEEFTEPQQEKSATKQKKQISDKKAKSKPPKRAPEKAPPSESEEDESEEEPPKKSKSKKTLKKPISEKRLEILRKGRELAAANRNKKKDEQISKLKKELWEEFNGKIPRASDKSRSDQPRPSVDQPRSSPVQRTGRFAADLPQEIISKMKENQIRSSLDPPTCSGRKIKSFCKIKI